MSEAARIKEKQDVRRFVTAGHATFSLRSSKTNAHLTFSVLKGKKSLSPGQEPPWFVKVRVGADYVFIGTIFPNEMRFIPKKGVLNAPEEAVKEGLKVFSWFWAKLLDSRVPAFEALEFWHEGVCSRCGDRLTKPESIATGLGPICRKKTR